MTSPDFAGGGANLLSRTPRPTLIAACGVGAGDYDNRAMDRAVESALNLAALDERVLFPILAAGDGGSNPASAAEAFFNALVEWNKRPPGIRAAQHDVFICSGSAVALDRIKELARAYMDSHVALASDPPATRSLETMRGMGYRTDSPSERPQDFIGVGAEIEAFAKLAAARSIDPPLAVGVFGDWGSGKSFFMKGVRRKIDEYAADARAQSARPPDREAHSTAYHADVVHIEFNAWHYIEANLWASLVEFIFCRLEEWLRQQDENGSQEVSDLFEALATSRQLKLETARAIMGANKELAEANQAVADAEAEKARKLSDKQVALKALLDNGLNEILASPEVEALRAQLDTIGLAHVIDNAGDAVAVGNRLTEQGNRVRLMWDAARESLRGGWGVAAIAFLLLVPLACALVAWGTIYLSRSGALAAITAGMSGIAGTLAAGTAAVRRFLDKVKPVLDKADEVGATVKSSINQLQAKVVAQSDATIAEKQSAVTAAEQTLAAAQERLKLAAEQAADAQNRYASESARGRLSRFIRERLADGTYGKHLGLIATIRRDFEQLTNLVEAARSGSDEQKRYDEEEAAYAARVDALIAEARVEEGGGKAEFPPDDSPMVEAEEQKDGRTPLLGAKEVAMLREAQNAAMPSRSFGRIILYIDDLDRCPPGKVVEVIQAVHMLLSFRLFVVFVAVDARWVKHALHEIYEKQLTGSKTSDAPLAVSDTATAEDYMEKIFQIPYWVQPLRDTAAAGFINKLVADFQNGQKGGEGAADTLDQALAGEDEETTDSGQSGAVPAAIAESAATDGARSGNGDALGGETMASGEGLGTGAGSSVSDADNSVTNSHSDRDGAAALFEAEKLELVDADLRALAALAPTIGDSPRRVKRFFNTYLLIQAIAAASTREDTPDVDADLRKSVVAALRACSFDQQALALATCLALAMQNTPCRLEPRKLAALNTSEVDSGQPESLRPLLHAYMKARDELKPEPDEQYAEGLESAFGLFLPIARRYTFHDAG
ncbi:MAG: P-loop NTPase fold protein [Sphingomonas bacterium]